ncbi:MAG: TolC family protein [Bryobacteraceae bacterium]|nr:TolC family protein [Bryobacteraceae bacterium]MDW8378620.1 TolC family protein [Bryobacterales bacterium]
MTLRLAAILLPVFANAQQTLRLEDVLESVNRNYPPLLAILRDLDIARGDMRTALGRFDTVLRLRFDAEEFGFYDNERVDFGIEQATPFLGTTYFAGWRRGEGNFASYDGKLETRSLGELRGGFRLPLFRDRAIDSRRADLRKADLGIDSARLSIDQQKIVILQLATQRYWSWVAAGQRLQVAEALLKIATDRDAFLRESVRLGQLPQIEVTDNERAILQRRSQIVEAERGLQQATIELSLFYRDSAGRPVLAQASQLPAGFPPMEAMTESRLQEDIETALRRRPELQRLVVQRAQTQVDADLARNQLLPNVDLLMSFTAEGGSGTVKRGPRELKASVVFDLPFQRRQAAGRLQAAEARLSQFDLRQQFAREQITAEVQDAVSAVQAAYRRALLIAEEVKVARRLQELEKDRFDLGDSTLFLVNLREQATFEAAVREVAAQSDYFRSLALYELAIASALSPQPQPPKKTP